MGKIERGEHIPSLPLIFKIAAALECGATDLMAATEAQLGSTAA
jgi:transcriptional regulator with XRE-family HTH domain